MNHPHYKYSIAFLCGEKDWFLADSTTVAKAMASKQTASGPKQRKIKDKCMMCETGLEDPNTGKTPKKRFACPRCSQQAWIHHETSFVGKACHAHGRLCPLAMFKKFVDCSCEPGKKRKASYQRDRRTSTKLAKLAEQFIL